jgi:hypothetical protein
MKFMMKHEEKTTSALGFKVALRSFRTWPRAIPYRSLPGCYFAGRLTCLACETERPADWAVGETADKAVNECQPKAR